MNVPILTGGRQKGDEMVARADIEQAQLQQKQVQELAALDTRSAWAELVAARAAWEASAGRCSRRPAPTRSPTCAFANGVSTQLELSDSRLLLQQAEANRALAARDLQVARARVALLPELPLGAGTPGAARPAVGQAPQPAPTPQQQQQGRGQFTSAAAPGAAADGDQVVMTRHRVATGFRELVARPARRGWLALPLAAVAGGRGVHAPKRRRRRRRGAGGRADRAGERRAGDERARSSSARSSPASCGRSARRRFAPSSAGRCSKCTSRKRRR